MQTDVGGELDAQTLIASYVYAARYAYSDLVLHNDNQIRLSPRRGEGQEPIRQQLWTLPEGRAVEYRDRFDNRVHRVRIIQHHDTLVVATAGQVNLSTRVHERSDAFLDEVRDLPDGVEHIARSPLVNPESVSALSRHVAGGSFSLLSVVRIVTDWVHAEIRYRRGTTDVGTTAEQVVSAMEGVCQDKTHLALGMLRALGVPCRYVSGLLTDETGETHAWLEFLHPEDGWVAADPTRGVINPPASDYIKLGAGRDYSDVSPVKGSFLSRGGAVECAAIASVKFEQTESTLDDALRLLESAYVVSSN